MATKKKRKTRHGPRRPQPTAQQRSRLTRHLSKSQARRRRIRLVVISAMVSIVAIGLVAGSLNNRRGGSRSVNAGATTTIGTTATTRAGSTTAVPSSTSTVARSSGPSSTVPPTVTTFVHHAPGDPGSALPPDPRHPDLSVTPGATDPAVTSATIHTTICRAGYATSFPAVPAALQARAFAEYGISTSAARSYVIDLLIPAELGGSNDLANLWPEPTSGADSARDKDKVEVRLHDAVCAGKVDLPFAQQEIVDWDTVPPA
jgi:hypothetical protein